MFNKYKKYQKANFDIPNLHKDVYDYAYQNSGQKKYKSRSFGWKLIYVLGSLLLIFGVVVLIDEFVNLSQYEDDYTIYNVESRVDLKNIINQSAKNSIEKEKILDAIVDFSGKVTDDAPTSDAPNNISPDYSNTLTQEENVSESDIIKTDGRRIFYANEELQKVQIYEVNSGQVQIVKEIEYYITNPKLYISFELYLTDTSLVVISYETNYFKSTNYVNVDIYNLIDFSLEKSLHLNGGIVDSRVYNNYLYIITSELIEKDNIENPSYQEDEEVVDIEYNKVIYSKYSENSYYNYIASVDLSTYEVVVNTQLGNRSYDVIYMSENKLYLVSPKYNSKVKKIISSVYAYDVKNGHATIFAITSFDGKIANQWYMSEYEGRLRIAYSNSYSEDQTKINRIIIFDINEEEKSFDKVGYLEEGLGKERETIKSVLFDGNNLEIVTYYRTDPLYKIELVDGITPVIQDELSMPGYSEFLKDFTYNNKRYLIGLGYTDFGAFKVSLYESGKENIQIGNDEVYDYIFSIEGLEKSSTIFFHETESGCLLGSEVNGRLFTKLENGGSYAIEVGYLLFSFEPDSTMPIRVLKSFGESIRRVLYIDGYIYAIGIEGITSYSYQNNELIK